MMYIDEADEGLARETSHPRFVELAPEAFYDEGDEFAPFGSDDGHDTLRSLEEWFIGEADDADPSDFLTDQLADWGLEVPADIPESTPEELLLWAAEDDMNEVYARSEARARVATALGQLKIVGRISTAVRAEAERGTRVLRIFTEDATRHPDWPYRAEALSALDEIERVLDEA